MDQAPSGGSILVKAGPLASSVTRVSREPKRTGDGVNVQTFAFSLDVGDRIVGLERSQSGWDHCLHPWAPALHAFGFGGDDGAGSDSAAAWVGDVLPDDGSGTVGREFEFVAG